jgi:hypothetical protein
VQELLCSIAGYLPDPYPSQRTLGKALGLRQQTITDQLARARAWGLISVTERPNEGGRLAGVHYHLVCLSTSLRAAITRHANQTRIPVRSKNSYSVGVQDEPISSRWTLPAGPSPADQTHQENVVPFNRAQDDDWSSPSIGEDPAAPLPGPATVKVDPAVYLARRFDSKWADVKKSTPALRVSRASSRGMAIGYIRKAMLPEISSEHVEAYMDAFCEAAAAGDVVVKEGQFAFERFTAWWGREDVEDPGERQSNRALSDLMREQARQIREGLTGS